MLVKLMRRPRHFVLSSVFAILLSGCQSTVATRNTAIQSALTKQLIGQKFEAAKKERDLALGKFRARMDDIQANETPILHTAVGATVNNISSYKSLAEFIYHLAVDSISGRNSTDAFIAHKFELGMKKPMTAIENSVNDALSVLDDDLWHSTIHLSNGLIVDLGYDLIPRNTPNSSKLQIEFDGIVKDYKARSTNLVSSRIMLWNLTDKVSPFVSDLGKKHFAGHVTKLVSTPLIALSDGPLPIGDVLIIGRYLWIAYDLSKVHEDFSREIKNTVNLGLDDFLADMNKAAEKAAFQRAADIDRLNAQLTEIALQSVQ